MKADGKDTTNLDKMSSNFDQLDTDQEGTVSMDEIQAGAKSLGIVFHRGGSHGHPRGPAAPGSGQMGASWGHLPACWNRKVKRILRRIPAINTC